MKRVLTALLWIGLLSLLIVLVGRESMQGRRDAPRINASHLLRLAEQGRIQRVEMGNGELWAYLNDSDTVYRADAEIAPEDYAELVDMGVPFVPRRETENSSSVWIYLLVPAVGLFFVFWLIKRKGGGGMDNILTLRKSRHQEISNAQARVTFRDIAGCDEAKAVLQDLVDFLKSPQTWIRAGARLPRGILLEGPPGSGKTLLARAVAGETNAEFFLVSASEFVEMFVGVGAARVRDLFETAVKQAPTVIFIDELDAIGRKRGSGVGLGHDEREQTLNQLLLSLDGFQANDRVVVIAATNRPDVLDPALVRPGRFDRRIKVPPLDENARLQALQIHTREKPLDDGADLHAIARATAGYSGAQLETLVNAAALHAVRRCRQDRDSQIRITGVDLREALVPQEREARRFNKLDAVLIESATQLTEPAGVAAVRVVMTDGTTVEGEVVWADASFIKLQRYNGAGDMLIAKKQVHSLEALAATEPAGPGDFATDRWATTSPGLAGQ